MNEKIIIEKLVHGGQGLGTLQDGRRVFVWNALPGEEVEVRLTKQKRSHAEAVAEDIIKASPDRQTPKDEAYLSTSPWQIIPLDKENDYKKQILVEAFDREKIKHAKVNMIFTGDEWNYRNKMEYSFWGDEQGLHLALYKRGTHGKQIVTGSSIARPEIDEAAQKICSILDDSKVRGSQLKTVVVRCNKAGDTVVALFVKDAKFPLIKELSKVTKGVVVYFSNPKSPASVITKELYCFGDITLTDALLGNSVKYSVNSFFQVNLPVFEVALTEIAKAIKNAKTKIDLYSGVGTIGVVTGCDVLVENDINNLEMAKININDKKVDIVGSFAEDALQIITNRTVVIVDPPRAGLHKRLTDRLNEVVPPVIVYLSCNPSTQARDIAMLQQNYELTSLSGFNFFPHTPHIESLAILTKRKSKTNTRQSS